MAQSTKKVILFMLVYSHSLHSIVFTSGFILFISFLFILKMFHTKTITIILVHSNTVSVKTLECCGIIDE